MPKKVLFRPSLLGVVVLLAGSISFAADAGRDFIVKSFGATGDGKTFDTQAIQSAIDAANQAGAGVVILPRGTYLSGSLWLKSRVELRVEAGATLLGSASRSDYRRSYRWYALLLADAQEDMAITGSGTIDGQARQLAQDVIRRVKSGEFDDPMAHNRPDANQRPQLINSRKCRNVRISGVRLRDASCWVQDYIQCDGLVIGGSAIASTKRRSAS